MSEAGRPEAGEDLAADLDAAEDVETGDYAGPDPEDDEPGDAADEDQGT